jgi:hypothetical protein
MAQTQAQKEARNKRDRAKRAKKKENIVAHEEKTEVKEEKTEVKKPAKVKKLLPIEKYYAAYANYTFSYDVIGRDGEPAVKRDNKNMERYDVSGNPVRIQKQEKFITINSKMSEGFLSYAEHDPNDESPQAIERGRALRAESEKEDIKLYDEETHEKLSNYAAYVERQKAKELGELVASKDDEIASLKARIAAAEGK